MSRVTQLSVCAAEPPGWPSRPGRTTSWSPPRCCTTWGTCWPTTAPRPRCAASTTCTSTSRCPSCDRCSVPRLLDAIGRHVDAKRYLCAVRAGLPRGALGRFAAQPASCRAGVFDAAQAQAFIAQPTCAGGRLAAAVGRRGQGARRCPRRRWTHYHGAGPALRKPVADAALAHGALVPGSLGADALSGGVLAAVLCGAALHASWNALIKSATDKSLDTALIHALGPALAVPLLLWLTGMAAGGGLAVHRPVDADPHRLLPGAGLGLPPRRPGPDLSADARRCAAAGGRWAGMR